MFFMQVKWFICMTAHLFIFRSIYPSVRPFRLCVPHEVFMIKINKAVAIKQRNHYVRKQLTPFCDFFFFLFFCCSCIIRPSTHQNMSNECVGVEYKNRLENCFQKKSVEKKRKLLLVTNSHVH